MSFSRGRKIPQRYSQQSHCPARGSRRTAAALRGDDAGRTGRRLHRPGWLAAATRLSAKSWLPRAGARRASGEEVVGAIGEADRGQLFVELIWMSALRWGEEKRGIV